MIEFYRRIYSNYFRSQKGSCLNKYHTVKKNIEKQINDFYKISGRNVYKEWDQLYKYIIDTDKDLKVCYDNKYVNVKLIEDDTIKKFTEKCKRNRTCYNVAPPAIKPPIIKPTTQKHCKDRDSCKSKTPGRVDFKSQSKLIPGPTDSKSLDTIGIQTKQHSGKTLEDNNPQTQDSAGNVIAEKTSSDKDISSEIAHNLSPAESTSDSVQRAEVDPLPTATVGGSTDTVFSDSGKTGSEAVSSASLASASRDVGNNGVTYDAISSVFKAPDGEIKIDKVSHDHTHDSEGLCIEGKCNEAQNAEITSDNNNDILGTLSHVFEVIQENKDNMIKASAPMGIVLLLTLIFKYTPLWRVLTKKNGKKGAGIIEELNSVVQEPSIMDDERSIPFSYGAFEYSSFDQNVY
ncbi:PIR protein [Plasmodium vivax]|uniref:VIR protein n=1 Tax=Plasmodium vivax TaxID=5855 RepID=A0A565A6S8_PLAVI|nr:PIR protein [Plasmodium vivax]